MVLMMFEALVDVKYTLQYVTVAMGVNQAYPNTTQFPNVTFDRTGEKLEFAPNQNIVMYNDG